MPLDDRAIAITATFTAEALQPALAFWAGELGLDHEIRFAPYNQLFQQLLDPAGLFARNRTGFNVALVRFDDWRHAGVEESIERLISAVRVSPAPLILVICPSTGSYELSERKLLDAVAALPSVYPVTPCEIQSLYPVDQIHDPHADELGHLPYTALFFVSLATAIARKIHALSAPPYKVIALDCDDTLWSGICGEDGPENVVIDTPRRALQQFMADRRRAGMLLVLCSKNEEADVLATFHVHPDMPLWLKSFSAYRLNWDSKAANLIALANELDVGLDSFILVDDNPKECAEAQAAIPGLLALPLPTDHNEIPDFLRHVWAFDRARITEEDRLRPELYAQRAERAHAERTAASLEEFLASLDLQVTITPMEPSQLARVAQLTRRTNQMNTTCRRRSEGEIESLPAEVLTVTVSDRFGSYGLSGVMIFSADRKSLVVDTFLLSCRALGRGVEHRMLCRLGEIALERGLDHLDIEFIPSQRNQPARLFLNSLHPPNPDGVYRLTAREAAAIRYNPAQPLSTPAPAPNPVTEPRPKGAVPRPDYLKIATALRTPAAILARIHAAAAGRPAPATAVSTPPRTPLERELAELWASLLNLPAVGVHDNFFELGGHSLLAVQLLSRVRQIHGVDLSLEVVYSGDFTVAELAKAVELKEIEQSGADYQDILHELEGLSDDEVRALLAQEQEAE